MFIRSWALAALAVLTMVFVLRAADPPNFKADAVFKGSTLAGWHAVGDADWKAQNGELVGTAKAAAAAGS